MNQYKSPELEVVKFVATDIILTSEGEETSVSTQNTGVSEEYETPIT